MDSLFEYRLIQNTVLAAELIWHSVAASSEASKNQTGVMFSSIFLVLPIAFHQRSAIALATKQQPGALYKALAEERTIPTGLQHRMEAMADQTLDALNMAFDSGLLVLNDDQEMQIFSGRKTPPTTHHSSQVKASIGAARRLGQAFAELEFPKLCALLEVKF